MKPEILIGLVPVLFFALIFGGIVFAIVFFIKRRKMLKAFALENGYTYSRSGNIESIPSLYLKIGHSRYISNLISGNYKVSPIKFFDFRSTIGYGKHQRHVNFSVFEIEYKSNLKRFLLLSRKMRFSPGNLYSGFQNGFGREIKLEGDFHKYFTLYVPEDYEIEVFQIFTPDTMAKFIDLARDFSFEFVDNKILIYTRGLIYKKEKLTKVHELVKILVDELAVKLERI
ncbi:MAG: DUF3137 domain-containing protein [Candidatus Pacebacteria bacterium]|nr:DUF3137 domain-containing protein [Candidatus Paceibacterota bacterium]